MYVCIVWEQNFVLSVLIPTKHLRRTITGGYSKQKNGSAPFNLKTLLLPSISKLRNTKESVMAKSWTEKRRLAEENAINKELDSGYGSIDFEGKVAADTRAAAMGEGEEELFERKLTKEEKKAAAKVAREAKKMAKVCASLTCFALH